MTKLGQPLAESNLAPLKEERSAASAMVVAGVVVLGERAGKGPLGAFLAQHAILLRREAAAPLGIAAWDRISRVTVCCVTVCCLSVCCLALVCCFAHVDPRKKPGKNYPAE